MNPDRLLHWWQALSRWPGGKWLYGTLIGRAVPYSGTIGARVEHLERGHVVLSLRDRHAVRNHLGSVHAIALMNLGELASGLAMLTAAGANVRGIVTAIRMEYHHKARGRLIAESRAAPPAVTEPVNADVTAEIQDAAGTVVAVAHVTWRLSQR